VKSGALEALARWLRSGHPPEPPLAHAELERLVDIADSQRVAPLLYAAVVDRDEWPESALARLRDRHHASFARGARQLELVGAVLEAFERRGVRALPLKGAAVAESFYDSIADRPMADVDVLVLAGWSEAVALLKGQGLELLDRADHAWTFRDAQGQLLELHHSVTSCPGLYPLDAEGLWQRSLRGAGQVGRRPAAEDLLVQLALHAAFQHALMLTLGQYLDFKRVVAAPLFDSERFRSLAFAAKAGRAVAASFAVAEALVGLDLAPELSDWVRERRPPALSRWLASELQDPLAFVQPGPLPLMRVRWSLLQGRRWELLARTLSPRSPGSQPALPIRLFRMLERAVGLVWRWLILR
jgi:hypothetical protein